MAKDHDYTFEPKKLTPAEGLSRIYKFCAYQERSHQEVKDKLYGFGLTTDSVNELLSRLIVEGFLNEERFAKAFSGGKFRIKKWGRNKITYALEAKGLTKNCIRHGLQEIVEPDYSRALREIIQKKADQSTEVNPFKKRDKIGRYAIAKGYEPELVWQFVKELIADK